MKTNYSILCIHPSSYSKDVINIGLLVFAEEKILFQFSEEKLKIVKPLLADEEYSLIKSFLKSLQQEFLIKEEGLFNHTFDAAFNSSWVNTNYIGYLSKYSNNLISFSSPIFIDLQPNETTFEFLFGKYVFKTVKENISISSLEDVVKENKEILHTKVKDRVNWNCRLSHSNINTLFMPLTVDFIGENGTIVTGETFNFDKPTHYLKNDIASYVTIIKAIDEFQPKKNGKFFVIGQEPSKSNVSSHKVWNDFRQSSFISYIDFNEMAQVEEYVTSKNVKPLFEECD